MRTACNDEELAAGFLFTESILGDRGQVASIAITGDNQEPLLSLVLQAWISVVSNAISI
jgi:formate dehydrogenase assembly factor FdhD